MKRSTEVQRYKYRCRELQRYRGSGIDVLRYRGTSTDVEKYRDTQLHRGVKMHLVDSCPRYFCFTSRVKEDLAPRRGSRLKWRNNRGQTLSGAQKWSTSKIDTRSTFMSNIGTGPCGKQTPCSGPGRDLKYLVDPAVEQGVAGQVHDAVHQGVAGLPHHISVHLLPLPSTLLPPLPSPAQPILVTDSLNPL